MPAQKELYILCQTACSTERENCAETHIAKVEQPMKWVSSMVAVTRGGKVRICFDPSILSKVLKREHYPMYTIEEVVSVMPGAKIFCPGCKLWISVARTG